jgi:hypothetical protein
VPLGCRRLSAASLIAAMAVVLPHGASAQDTATSSSLLRPVIDGDAGNPPRFGKPRSGVPATRSRFAPVGKGAPKASSPPGALRTFGNSPGFGAGSTGFVSTNPRLRTARLRVRGPVALLRGRIGTSADGVSQPQASAIHPATAAARAGASVPPPLLGGFDTPPPRRRPPPELDPFEPLGVRAGSFLLRPAIEFTGGYDTDPARTTNGRGSALLIVAPELQARSEWQRHALNADIRGSYTAYERSFTPDLDRPFLESKITGRIDVTRDSRIDLENRFRITTDNPGSPNLQAGLAKLPINTTVGGTVGVAQRFNRLELAVKGSVDRTVYQDSTLTDGTTTSNADRDFNQYAGVLRGSYELTPGVRPFVEAGRDSRIHDLAIDRTGAQRDSDGTTARIGTTYELTRLLTGEASVGYLVRTYKDPTLPDLRGLIYDASLIWTATVLTKVTLTARSTAEETTLAGVSGTLRRDVGLQVDHAFRRWLLGTLKFGFGADAYVGSTREDDRYTASAALTYKATREVQIKGEFRRDWLKSTATGVDYTANIFLLGLRLQR